MPKKTSKDGSADSFILDRDYLNFLGNLKAFISQSRVQASIALNQEVIRTYWGMGKMIVEKQKETQWGEKFLERLSQDLRQAFPETRGYSLTNLKYMRIFSITYPSVIGQQLVDQLPWGYITILIRIKNESERNWYIKQCLEEGWARSTLER